MASAKGAAQFKQNFARSGFSSPHSGHVSTGRVYVCLPSSVRKQCDSHGTTRRVPTGARLNRMELNGALSNPRLQLELPRLGVRHTELLADAEAFPLGPRALPRSIAPVLSTVTRVLESAERPMRAREVHRAAERLGGTPLRWTSVKAALAAATGGSSPRFERVAYGTYQMTR